MRCTAAAARGSTEVASRQRYAHELLRQERPQEAAARWQQLLTGLYEHDPNLMLRLARAERAPKHYRKAQQEWLDAAARDAQ